MFKLFIILCTIYLAFGGLIIDNNNSNSDYEFTGKSWVVLCSGSSGWSNYAHQANVYHAYQTFRARGIPEENIIIFHYDNIANSTSNPTPGVVINSPTGPNVYVNIPKHYTGDDVNPETFLKVLKGDKDLESQGKRVLKSGPNDHVFVQFTDHGAPGMVMFESNPLHAQDLNDAL
ncbi:legumain-like, partial [Oppia nitens]|uniref:legumain-like n=1 Tax=Oppia nitens TaxID=1686743 RepID=UPI0023D9EBC9